MPLITYLQRLFDKLKGSSTFLDAEPYTPRQQFLYSFPENVCNQSIQDIKIREYHTHAHNIYKNIYTITIFLISTNYLYRLLCFPVNLSGACEKLLLGVKYDINNISDYLQAVLFGNPTTCTVTYIIYINIYIYIHIYLYICIIYMFVCESMCAAIRG